MPRGAFLLPGAETASCHSPYLGGLHLLLDDGGVDARTLQVVDNVLGVADGGQQGRHVIPELLRQFQDVEELDLALLGPGSDVLPEEGHLVQLILDL